MAHCKVETITGDLATITRVQTEFLVHPHLVYFRKGEFENALEIAWEWLDLVAALIKNVSVIATAAGITTAMLLKRRKEIKVLPKSDGRDLRVLACIEDPDPTVATRMLEETGWKKRHISREAKGRLRYFVSSQEYFLFFRNPDDSFHGLRGNDNGTINCLQNLFLQEWKDASKSEVHTPEDAVKPAT